MPAFKVMTWNVENLFRPKANAPAAAVAAYRTKIDNLAQAIRRLDPDVVGFQEIGGPEPMQDLLALLGSGYRGVAVSKFPDARGIRVGFLSKPKLDEVEDISQFPGGALPSVPAAAGAASPAVTTFGRGILRVRVRITASVSVHLLNAHLKSKLLSFTGTDGGSRFVPRDENERARVAGAALLRRTAEAVALRVKANQVVEGNATKHLIVLGDMNDVPEAATTQLLQGPGGDEIGTQGFLRPDRGDDARLFNLAPCIPAARRFSRVYERKGELIDHILASVEFFPGQPRRLPEVDSHIDLNGSLPSVSDHPGDREHQPVSDHAPITAVFQI
jgi:endonuclease/exonuclease/phosphatase family metal-dependent hydrolase